MGREADDDVTVSVQTVNDAATPSRQLTWGNDVIEPRGRRWNRVRIREFCNRWTSTCSPFLMRVFTAKKQWIALFLFLGGAAAPFVMLGYYTPVLNHPPGSWPPFYNVFAAKYLNCGDSIDSRPAGTVIAGFKGLFVLDSTWGSFNFSTVKTIDVAWDIIVGRSVQLLCWWVAYAVFSDALLCVIERHPASFRIFQRIALEGPGLHSLWTLCKELLSVKSKRTKALFAYLLLSTSYVLCIPMFLGAMTGYDSTSTAWIDVEGTNNIVPTSYIKDTWAVKGTWNTTFDQPVCASTAVYGQQGDYVRPRLDQCTCQMSNGTLAPPGTFSLFTPYGLLRRDQYWGVEGTKCLFGYLGNNETFQQSEFDPKYYDPRTRSNYKKVTHNCNETVIYKLNNQQYDLQTLDGTMAYCYDNKPYDIMQLQGRSRCLPDTVNPTYEWGFSTMMAGLFVFIHFGWAVSMYIAWLDAQSKSTLIREGYQMTPLRAAFAMAKAVKRKTGLGERQLVRHNTKDLNKELDGTRREKGTKIEYSIFAVGDEEDVEEAKGLRRRRALALDGIPSCGS